MIGILQFAKDALEKNADPAGLYLDFTMGRGRDTLFLSRLAPEGRVLAFDIQQAALDQTAALLRENGAENVRLVLDSHANFERYLTPEDKISGGLFNLGFLPGGDRSVTTRCGATLAAVSGAVRRLKKGGVLGVAVYPGHLEGEREGKELGALLAGLDKSVCDAFVYRILNVPDAPFLYVVEKRGGK